RTFVAATRQSRWTRPTSRNTRATLASSENWAGPRSELRPASPQVPGSGAAYASGFAYEPGDAGTGDTPVRRGRVPTNPVVPPTSGPPATLTPVVYSNSIDRR